MKTEAQKLGVKRRTLLKAVGASAITATVVPTIVAANSPTFSVEAGSLCQRVSYSVTNPTENAYHVRAVHRQDGGIESLRALENLTKGQKSRESDSLDAGSYRFEWKPTNATTWNVFHVPSGGLLTVEACPSTQPDPDPVLEPIFELGDPVTNSPVVQRQNLVVDVDVTNSGNAPGEANIDFEIVGVVGSEQAKSVEVAVGETKSVSFTHSTAGMNFGEYTVKVSLGTQEKEASVTVLELLKISAHLGGGEGINPKSRGKCKELWISRIDGRDVTVQGEVRLVQNYGNKGVFTPAAFTLAAGELRVPIQLGPNGKYQIVITDPTGESVAVLGDGQTFDTDCTTNLE